MNRNKKEKVFRSRRDVEVELERAQADLDHARARMKELSTRWESCPEGKRSLLADFLERVNEDIARHEENIAQLECELMGRED